MTITSNLYAEKVYAEHPISLWALDDSADYISLISENQRDIDDTTANLSEKWTISGGTSSVAVSDIGQTFKDSALTLLEVTPPVSPSTSTTITCIGPELFAMEDLDQDIHTFAMGLYFYSDSPYIEKITIGYRYVENIVGYWNQKDFLEEVNTTLSKEWGFVSKTFAVPDFPNPPLNPTFKVRPIIKFTVSDGGTLPSDYRIYVNGITIGQISENFNATSLGISPISFPQNINLNENHVVEAVQYSGEENSGYYIVKNNVLVARSASIPMTYGSSNIVRLYSNSNNPSMIFKGSGFLHNFGKYSEYTAEFWLRLKSQSASYQKIFGPINSTDGIYVNSGFIYVSVGDYYGSYSVGQWNRPMLVDFIIKNETAKLLINGEEVISFSIDKTRISFPEGIQNDWLGFYSYNEIINMEIDNFAIYSYEVSPIVAKRRFAYGQAVEASSLVDKAYNGSSAFIDYTFSNYTANYTYPDFARWDQAKFENVEVSRNFLSVPQYNLPNIFTNIGNIDEVYEESYNLYQIFQPQPPDYLPNPLGEYPFINLRPTQVYDQSTAYLYLSKIGILKEKIKTIYGVFAFLSPSGWGENNNRTLFKIEDPLTGNYFRVYTQWDSFTSSVSGIIYELNVYGEVDQVLKGTASLNLVGIDVDDLKSKGGIYEVFFNDLEKYSLYIAGDKQGNTVNANIYTFGICSKSSTERFLYFRNGSFKDVFPSPTYGFFNANMYGLSDEVIENIASYTLIPKIKNQSIEFDIGVYGYWQDYAPISYFCQYVENQIGEKYYTVDFLQFNIDYPANKNIVSDYYGTHYDTSNESVRSFISLQYIEDGANTLSFSQIDGASSFGPTIGSVVTFTNNLGTKEVLDNTLIYLPHDIDPNKLALVYTVEFAVDGIFSKNTKIRKLDIAAQSLNDNYFNPIGTKFGIDLYPYTKTGIYYDYKAHNPISIYKGSTPYLYLTDMSGIEVRNYVSQTNRGVSIPINAQLSAQYHISAAQIWGRFNETSFSLDDIKIFEIEYKEDTLEFYVTGDTENTSRGKISVISKNTGLEYTNGFALYINGNLCISPYINQNEWFSLGINFSDSLVFDSYLGRINLTGPFLFNNISLYRETDLVRSQKYVYNAWLDISEENWQFWTASNWNGVLVKSSSPVYYGADTKDVYTTYCGTNKIITDDNLGISLADEKIKIYSDTQWSSFIKTPA